MSDRVPVLALLHPLPAPVQDWLRNRLGNRFELRVAADRSEPALIDVIGEARYAVAHASVVTDRVLGAAHKLRLLHKWGAGVDTIDLAAAHRRGIIVARTPASNAEAVADLTVGLMLAGLRRISFMDRRLRDGGWEDEDAWLGARSLAGATVGLLGMGAIGSAVARRLRGFGCNVVAWQRPGGYEAGRVNDVPRLDLVTLLSGSDVVSLHLPLTAATRHVISAAELAVMRPHAWLVNTARGLLVDESALMDALRHRRIGGAALDVFAVEPLPSGHPLRGLANVVLSPHVGGRTVESVDRVVSHWIGNLLRDLRGEPLPESDLVLAVEGPAPLRGGTPGLPRPT